MLKSNNSFISFCTKRRQANWGDHRTHFFLHLSFAFRSEIQFRCFNRRKFDRYCVFLLGLELRTAWRACTKLTHAPLHPLSYTLSSMHSEWFWHRAKWNSLLKNRKILHIIFGMSEFWFIQLFVCFYTVLNAFRLTMVEQEAKLFALVLWPLPSVLWYIMRISRHCKEQLFIDLYLYLASHDLL